MKSTVLQCASVLCFLCFCTFSSAEVRLPSILADNMVLQQRSSVNIWGWANPGEIVHVKAGWATAPVSAVAGSDGKWQIRLRTTKAGGPYGITITGKNQIVLKNVMLGEVWVCSGQSNMEFTIKMLGGWESFYKADKEDLVKNGYSSLRLFTVAKDTSSVPLDTCRGTWLVANPEVVENFSATAYFFGRELSRKLKVPIGLISSNWGGTPAEAWTSIEDLKGHKDLAFYLRDQNKSRWFPSRASVLYNAMIHPLTKFAVKGVIWYQGESNRNEAHVYAELMGTLIANWRRVWNLGAFPFYYVQIAPFDYEEPLSCALLREAQLKTMSVANTGMAVTMDIGDTHDIHPKNKQDVGRRLALWALARTYGAKVPAFSGPLYRSMKQEGNGIRVFFDHAGRGLVTRGERLDGFTIAGSDREFVDAEAVIQGSTVVVSSGRVANPASVRFAFTNTASSGLFNKEGLPASSFRTDDWPIVTDAVSITAAYDSTTDAVFFAAASSSPHSQIRYTLDGSDPTLSSPLSEGKITLTRSCSYRARAFRDGFGSTFIAHREFTRHSALGKTVTYSAQSDGQYPGGGRLGLVDGLRGTINFRDGSWQGFKRSDLDVTIDLGDTLQISEVQTGYLQDQRSWIFFPRSVEYSLSLDGKSFVLAAAVPNDMPDSTAGTIRKSFSASLHRMPARFVRVKATNIGQCPPWHAGRGGDTWLFVDEIIVN